VVTLLSDKPRDASWKILATLLSGPIDIDKMDYLMRDSLHAGVPYGRNFDQQRLVGSLCLNEAGDALAITDKGKAMLRGVVFIVDARIRREDPLDKGRRRRKVQRVAVRGQDGRPRRPLTSALRFLGRPGRGASIVVTENRWRPCA
jgi:hypothetical protein